MGEKVMKFLVESVRILVGAVFVFSGFVKAIDPIGTAYKIQDYFFSFGLPELFPWILALALPSAVVMVAAEIVLGALLLLGVYRMWAILFIGLFMVFFTPLTLWVALNNPISDCGCFGDAFTITNWQSFSKNVVLLLSSVFLIFNFKRITPLFSEKIAKFVAIFVILFSALFTLYNLHRLPAFDFRPYRIGTNIPESMRVSPENADVFETIFIYSKDGVEQEFTEDDFPWDDPAWTFVDRKTRLVRAGEQPAIESFIIEELIFDEATQAWIFGDNVTDIVLSDPSYSFWMISYSLERMRTRQLRHFKAVNRYAQERGYSFYLLTASPLSVISEWENRYQTGFQFIHTDKRVLQTVIRANPGLMLLKNGTVINKWAASEVVTVSRLTTPLAESRLVEIRDRSATDAVRFLIIILLFLVPLAFFRWID